MLCPFLNAECRENKCAIWTRVDEIEVCAIQRLPILLNELDDKLANIADNVSAIRYQKK